MESMNDLLTKILPNIKDTAKEAVESFFMLDSVVVNGERREIFKDPITDDGIKKSAKGLIKVDLVDGEYALIDQVSVEEEEEGQLQTIYKDGKFCNQVSLQEIRTKINGSN